MTPAAPAPAAELHVGRWVQISPTIRKQHRLPNVRGCIEQLAVGKALVRIPCADWPFPATEWLPRDWLLPAPAPRRQKLSGKIEG